MIMHHCAGKLYYTSLRLWKSLISSISKYSLLFIVFCKIQWINRFYARVCIHRVFQVLDALDPSVRGVMPICIPRHVECRYSR